LPSSGEAGRGLLCIGGKIRHLLNLAQFDDLFLLAIVSNI
jgi:hypothetical protein